MPIYIYIYIYIYTYIYIYIYIDLRRVPLLQEGEDFGADVRVLVAVHAEACALVRGALVTVCRPLGFSD
jgi:hypothetical protein